MSSGAECNFTEVAPGRWKYWLQAYPYGETQQGSTHGPFPGFIQARDDLDRNHQNPGGYGIRCLEVGHVHEWEEAEQQVPVGVTVSITIHSLGPSPTREQIIDLLHNLSPETKALRTTPSYGFKNGWACASCGAPKSEG